MHSALLLAANIHHEAELIAFFDGTESNNLDKKITIKLVNKWC